MTYLRFALALALLLVGSSIAYGDDWAAARLRGSVFYLVGGEWQKLERNGLVSDQTYIRTLASGRVDLVRGGETVSIGPDTQIRIFDKGSEKPFTTVQQDYGTVTVEANVEQVEHFSVETPFLAAVVKGTIFTVISTDAAASVSVQRGHVEVNDKQDKTHVTIAMGQSAATTAGHGLEVSGSGDLPIVLGEDGLPASIATLQNTAEELEAAAEAARQLAAQLDTPEARAAAKAAKEAADAAKKAAKDAEKQAKDDAKAADKVAKEGAKLADKALKDAEKANDKAGKAPKKDKKN